MIALTHAMVLAAGLGTRMRPLTDARPKPLLELDGRSLLDHALDRLEDAGVTRLVVNAHWHGDQIVAAIDGRPTTATFNGHGGCFIETGGGRAAYGAGDIYAEPTPTVTLRPPARRWHLGKVLFELNVVRRWL